MAGKVIDKDLGMDRILAGLEKLSGLSIEAGILADAEPYPSGKPVVEVGVLYELGIDGPARPFIRETIDAQRERYADMMQAVAAKVSENGGAPPIKRVAAAIYRDLRRAVKRQKLYRTGHLFRSMRTRIVEGEVTDE